jgi:hypothetical protein
MSVFDQWPGAGPTPEPEAEGFREEQIEAEKQRQIDVATESLQRSKDAKDEFSAAPPPEPPPVEGRSKSTSHDTKTHDTKATSKS